MPLNARRLCPAFWGGRGAIMPGVHARCAFTDHPIRRGDGDGKQDRESILAMKKGIDMPASCEPRPMAMVYAVKVSGQVQEVRLVAESPYGGWVGRNLVILVENGATSSSKTDPPQGSDLQCREASYLRGLMQPSVPQTESRRFVTR
jgi:hypothetical protein